LTRSYDRAHALIGSRGIVGVWDSEEHVRSRWSSDEFENVLTSVGFPSPKNPNLTLPDLHAIEPRYEAQSVVDPRSHNTNPADLFEGGSFAWT